MLFLSTPSARRATPLWLLFVMMPVNFYPRPPRGGRHALPRLSAEWIQDFYPRPPRGGRPLQTVGTYWQRCISIHALLAEGDYTTNAPHGQEVLFLSTPSSRRATDFHPLFIHFLPNFYPRPPRGGRHCGRGDPRHPVIAISIHALLAEGDDAGIDYNALDLYFYPRPPRGGRPCSA